MVTCRSCGKPRPILSEDGDAEEPSTVSSVDTNGPVQPHLLSSSASCSLISGGDAISRECWLEPHGSEYLLGAVGSVYGGRLSHRAVQSAPGDPCDACDASLCMVTFSTNHMKVILKMVSHSDSEISSTGF